MSYDAGLVIDAYTKHANAEDEAEKQASLRVEIPREFIKKYLRASDVVLDAGGGTGINAIMMAERCQRVTLLDITPQILDFAGHNVSGTKVADRIDLVQGDIADLSRFPDGTFSFVVCVGDAISYVLDERFRAMEELVRVAQPGSILIIGCDSKLGFMRLKLGQGLLDEAIDIYRTGATYCGMGPKTHLYTVPEMGTLLQDHGCDLLETASTPTLADAIDRQVYRAYHEKGEWEKLKSLELEICTRPELLGMGLHLLFVARKRCGDGERTAAPTG
ncbi:class I SAM-dependent methyltransferase [Chloroflexota bacterium]